MLYDSIEEIRMRLGNTVVMYDDTPVFCTETVNQIGKEFYIRILQLPRLNGEIDIAISDPKLNVTSYKLGYFNHDRHAYYLARMPVRRYKQGLNGENTVVIQGNGRGGGRQGPGWRNTLSCIGFKESLMGKYPTFAEATALLESGARESVAFSRRFALFRDPDLGFFELRFKGERVAFGEVGQFRTPTELEYLKEQIQEHGISVR